MASASNLPWWNQAHGIETGRGLPHLEHIKAHPEVCTLGSHLQQGMVCFQVELDVSGLELLSELQGTLKGRVLPGRLSTDIEQGCVCGIRGL